MVGEQKLELRGTSPGRGAHTSAPAADMRSLLSLRGGEGHSGLLRYQHGAEGGGGRTGQETPFTGQWV